MEMITTSFATVTGDSNGFLERAIAILALECHVLDIPCFNLLNEQAIGHVHSISITRIALSKKHKEIISNNGYNHKNDCTEKQTTPVASPSTAGIIAIASIAIAGSLWATCPSRII